MMVMILESVKPSMRGELSRWMIEPHPGVFVGHVNRLVRDRLWEKACKNCKDGGVIQMWNANNEQRFDLRMFGKTNRQLVEMEGLKLILQPRVE